MFVDAPGFVKRNWNGLLHIINNKLNRWRGVLSTLSFRGHALVINNLVSPLLWHKMIVLQPPVTLVSLIQKCLLDFFWDGKHWLKPETICLPLAEGGHRHSLLSDGLPCLWCSSFYISEGLALEFHCEPHWNNPAWWAASVNSFFSWNCNMLMLCCSLTFTKMSCMPGSSFQ